MLQNYVPIFKLEAYSITIWRCIITLVSVPYLNIKNMHHLQFLAIKFEINMMIFVSVQSFGYWIIHPFAA